LLQSKELQSCISHLGLVLSYIASELVENEKTVLPLCTQHQWKDIEFPLRRLRFYAPLHTLHK
jgi:hypothetical protein